ncbi:MAG TPA: hypothetical protein DCQ26_19690 [Marinilabiliales bacterium]|nr:hypothetical protein [Salinivirgaceae bacterium]OFX42869.1 MAG: hypothetical protein A2W95_16755 [Bacteroidetes bacterium GWA2_40_14]OFX62453.1 MAG: hypothetical protein A2W84_12705 [Bacteroidetes bacterium GWC2_40_13]OFX72259.1 MAG: hypothetical protein A2W96_17615 [Bacteroidetes bacterium GWD2_40_43]OFX90493.1 MAG: hypothetical protein A2W97_01785 [Bacteroidetes bacterium GWE2_40_63]OFY17261.1 MAG: hypothetical protein A2W88_15080 [Bacteroidetes bacterium GWF2_40_13]OFZ29093.1 MAG: hypot
MKNVFKIFLTLIIGLHVGTSMAQSDDLVNVCALGIGNATYLKDYKVKLSASSVSPPSAKFNVILNKGTMYKITVCNAEGYAGQAVVELMENAAVLGTNLKADGSFVTAVGFQCQKTGMYSINISFKDGKEGAAVAILSYINM